MLNFKILALTKRSAAFLLALSATLATLAQPNPAPRDDFWITDGPVNAMTIRNKTVYIGGNFSYAGPQTGPAASFDLATGEYLGRFPRVNGTISAMEPDGAGGWFLAGDFTAIGSLAVTYVAHVFADLSFDYGFRPAITGSGIFALAHNGNRLYIGGQFTKIGGVNQQGFAVLNTADGSLIAGYPTVSGRVNALLLNGNIVYLGGSFVSIGTNGRNRIAAIDLQTAKTTDWNPNADNTVLVLALAENTLYVGGQFSSIGGKPRNRLAALDLTTGQASTWNPNPNGNVHALEISGDTLYLGGEFTGLGIQNRNKFSAVSRTTASVLPLDLQVEGTSSQVLAIRMVNNTLLVAGNFTRLQNRVHPLIAAADPTTGDPLDQAPLGMAYNGGSDNAVIDCLAISGNKLVCAGSYQSLGGATRTHAAALDISSGKLLPWLVTPSSPVLAVASSPSSVYLAGGFTKVNGSSASGLVAVDPVYGERLPEFDFVATNKTSAAIVRSLFVTDTHLFVGGAFSSIRDKAFRMFAIADPVTGEAVNFDAKIVGGSIGVAEMAGEAGNIYIAGDFTSVAGQTRTRLAALSQSSGQLDSWNPAPNRDVNCLFATDSRLYVGGLFTSISAVNLRNTAVYELPSHNVLPFDAALPSSSAGITAIAATDNVAYFAGSFDSIGGDFHKSLAGLNSSSGLAIGWDPFPSAVPQVLALSDELIFVGGSFRTLGKSPNIYTVPNFAVYNRSSAILSHQLNMGTLAITATTGDRVRAILQSSPELPTWISIATNNAPGQTWTWTEELPAVLKHHEFFRVISE